MTCFVLNKQEDAKDIIPLTAGIRQCPSEHCYGPYVRDHYIVHFCLSGHGVLENADGRHEVSAGQLFLIRPGETTIYTADRQDPWQYTWLSFIGDRAGIFADGEAVRTSPYEIPKRLSELVLADVRSPDIFTALIYELIYELYTKDAAPTDKLSQIEQYIRYEYMNPITAEEIAKSFGFERSYLYRLFKARHGIGIKEYIIHTRLERARTLLCEGHTVSATAYMVGYGDEFNFSKAFKKHFGVSPGKVRKSEPPCSPAVSEIAPP